MRRAALFMFAALWSPTASFAAPCAVDALGPGSRTVSDDDGVKAAYRHAPGVLRPGLEFSVEVIACRADGEPPDEIRLDARMPAHGHGMNYTPDRTAVAPGHARFDGLLFHMPGDWEFVIDVYDDGKRHRLSDRVPVGQ